MGAFALSKPQGALLSWGGPLFVGSTPLRTGSEPTGLHVFTLHTIMIAGCLISSGFKTILTVHPKIYVLTAVAHFSAKFRLSYWVSPLFERFLESAMYGCDPTYGSVPPLTDISILLVIIHLRSVILIFSPLRTYLYFSGPPPGT